MEKWFPFDIIFSLMSHYIELIQSIFLFFLSIIGLPNEE